MILHLAIRADWEAAKSSGHYPWSTRGITVADEGYTHCSFEAQWEGVRDRFYADLATRSSARGSPACLRLY
jgi:glutathione S-transferase